MALSMNDALQTTLLLILGLQFKHIVCDGPLQTLQMVKDKSFYGKPLGVVHAFVHGVGSALILALVGLPVTLVLALAALDTVLALPH